jgi:hypothetical protein
MEDLLARERAAEQNVQYILQAGEAPIADLPEAFKVYRAACEQVILADLEHGIPHKEEVLWQAHTQGKKLLNNAVTKARMVSNEQPVQLRALIKLYLTFLKDSQKFYRRYIHKLNSIVGGIPELEAIAHEERNDGLGESSYLSPSPASRKIVLASCHRALIYLGDLSRYRASEKLDKTPDYGPAIGYYSLACTLCPSSGLGHHQQAVVALDQHQYLRAIYHLYRAIVVDEPHPLAAANLKRQFDRTNSAWDRGQLIKRGAHNDPDAAKQTLIGWFVRFHSMCSKGEPFRGHDELENEVLGQLSTVIKQRALDATLMRMIMTNLAAQFLASETFTGMSQYSATPSALVLTNHRKTYHTEPSRFPDFLPLQHQDVHCIVTCFPRRPKGRQSGNGGWG